MSKCIIVKLLREEIDNLVILAQRLEDESRLCLPYGCSCDKCFDEVIAKLKQLKKGYKRVDNHHPADNLLEIYEGFR